VTAVDPARHYHVRQATQHPVKEHARVTRFAEILSGPDASARAAELGELMYKSHKSYSACCLGSPGTDELVRLVRESGAESGLYGAKITGGGSGGTVAVLGRKGAREGVEAVAKEYERRTGHAPLIISGSSPGAVEFGYMVVSDGG
jgi:L-arabinokinase